jgi:hypothetical protein
MKSTQYESQLLVPERCNPWVRSASNLTSFTIAKLIDYHWFKGTKKLQGAVKAIQGRGKHVLCIVDTYNKLIDELQAMPRPSWMLPEHMPRPLDRRTAIDIDPDGP